MMDLQFKGFDVFVCCAIPKGSLTVFTPNHGCDSRSGITNVEELEYALMFGKPGKDVVLVSPSLLDIIGLLRRQKNG